jgi:ribonuclease HI
MTGSAFTPEVVIYTDGACRGNPGPGGWGAILMSGGRERELCGGELDTTNNRMELTAAIEALEALKRPCRVELHTDSQYLRNGITDWLGTWKARGWRTTSKGAVKNEDLWRRLDTARELALGQRPQWSSLERTRGRPGAEGHARSAG